VGAHKFSGRFAHALLDGTPDELLVPTQKHRARQASPSEQSMMERETDELLKHVDSIRASYGDEVLNLTTSCKYVEQLLANVRVRRYLAKQHSDILAALEQLISDMAGDKRRRKPPGLAHGAVSAPVSASIAR
jgi:hypothetical protein